MTSNFAIYDLHNYYIHYVLLETKAFTTKSKYICIYTHTHICVCFMNDCSNLSANHSTIFKKKWLHLYCNVVCECKFEHLGWESIRLLQEGWAREEVRERLQGSEHGRLGVAQNDCEQFSLIRAGTEVGGLPGKARKESNHQQKRNISFKPLQ